MKALYLILLLLCSVCSTRSELVWSNISQSNPLASASNFISVALKFNQTIVGDDTKADINFVLSGFNNAVASSTVQLLPISSVSATFPFSEYPTYEVGNFQNSSLFFSLPWNASLLSDTVYGFSFEIKNPYLNRDASSIFLSFPGEPGGEPVLVNSFLSEIFGVPGGSAPMRIVIPLFTAANASQTNVMAGGPNSIVVRIRSNVLLPQSSNFTLSGLYGLLQEDGQSFVILSDENSLENVSKWNATAALVTVICKVSIPADTVFTFSVKGMNSYAQQNSQDLKISASLAAGRYPVVIPRTSMAKSGLSLYGIPSGANPLKIVVPFFLNVSAFNRIYMAESFFSIILNVSSYVDILDASTFLLSGVKNVTNVSSVRIEPADGEWIQTEPSSLTATGIIQFSPAALLYANRFYLMSLNVSVLDLFNTSLAHMQLSAALADASGAYIGQISPFSILAIDFYVAESSEQSISSASQNVSSCVVCRDKPENSYWEDSCQCQWLCKHGYWATYNKSMSTLYDSVNCTLASEVSSDLLVLGVGWGWISCPVGGS